MNQIRKFENEIFEYFMERLPSFKEWVIDLKNGQGGKYYPRDVEVECKQVSEQDNDYIEFWDFCGLIFGEYLRKIYTKKDKQELKNFFNTFESLLIMLSKTYYYSQTVSQMLIDELFAANLEGDWKQEEIKQLQSCGLKDANYYKKLISVE